VESARLKISGIAFTAVLGLVGIGAVLGGLGYGAFGEEGLIGPGFLPILAGGLVALFAIFDIIGRLRKHKAAVDINELALGQTSTIALEEAEETSDLDIFGRTQKTRNRMLIAVIGIVLGTLLLVNLLGFLISFGVMMIVTAVFVERRKWLPSVIIAAAALGTAYLVFGVLLRVPLPQGLLGII